MGLFGNKKKEEIVAIFDIGSGSVGGAIINFPVDKSKLPAIIKSTRTEIDYTSNKINVSAFTKSMLKSLNQTAEKIYNNKTGAPDRIVCVVASPWYSSETKVVKIKKEIPFLFTVKVADDLVQKEIKSIIVRGNKKAKTIYNELEMMEHHVMDVSLNGYKVDSPIGVKTKSVEMNIVFSYSEKFILDKIRKEIFKTFHDTPLSFSSFIISSYFAVRNKYVSPDSYLLLDVGGEITEVGVISKGVLKASLSFPFGKKTIHKYISTKLEIELRDAKELFNLYISGHLSDKEKAKYEPLFSSIQNSWSEVFKQSLGNLPHVLALPSTIFLTADEDVIRWFSDTIKNEKFIQSMTINNECNVVMLKSSDFIKMCRVSDDFSYDPFLMIETIALIRK